MCGLFQETYDPLEVVKEITVDMVIQEMGTLLEEHGNEFPFENREAIFARWIHNESAYVYDQAQVALREHEEGITAYQKVLFQTAVVNRVCWRALKRIVMNRTPELPSSAIVGAIRNFQAVAQDAIRDLDYSLNGPSECMDEEGDDDDE